MVTTVVMPCVLTSSIPLPSSDVDTSPRDAVVITSLPVAVGVASTEVIASGTVVPLPSSSSVDVDDTVLTLVCTVGAAVVLAVVVTDDVTGADEPLAASVVVAARVESAWPLPASDVTEVLAPAVVVFDAVDAVVTSAVTEVGVVLAATELTDSLTCSIVVSIDDGTMSIVVATKGAEDLLPSPSGTVLTTVFATVLAVLSVAGDVAPLPSSVVNGSSDVAASRVLLPAAVAPLPSSSSVAVLAVLAATVLAAVEPLPCSVSAVVTAAMDVTAPGVGPAVLSMVSVVGLTRLTTIVSASEDDATGVVMA